MRRTVPCVRGNSLGESCNNPLPSSARKAWGTGCSMDVTDRKGTRHLRGKLSLWEPPVAHPQEAQRDEPWTAWTSTSSLSWPRNTQTQTRWKVWEAHFAGEITNSSQAIPKQRDYHFLASPTRRFQPSPTDSYYLAWTFLWFSSEVCVQLFVTTGLQHTRLPYPSPSPRVCPSSYPLSWWCHPTISSSVAPISSCICFWICCLDLSEIFFQGANVF